MPKPHYAPSRFQLIFATLALLAALLVAGTAYYFSGQIQTATGTGTDLGQELDLIATYAHNPNFDVQFGYSWFWYGNRVISNT